MQAEVEIFLHVGRVEDRYAAGDESLSLWCASVEDLAMWSSPASAMHAAVLGGAG